MSSKDLLETTFPTPEAAVRAFAEVAKVVIYNNGILHRMRTQMERSGTLEQEAEGWRVRKPPPKRPG